ncbi:hypothetical protein DFH11DRAFT_1875916 [Phellopilus nigrolimitatus]|nr:hypothetical protein DFH11DRAFT_1875916 [Phellopilus nigrolimitatus]
MMIELDTHSPSAGGQPRNWAQEPPRGSPSERDVRAPVATAYHPSAEYYLDLLELLPFNHTIYYKRANAYLSLGHYQDALRDLDTVLNLTSNNYDEALLKKGNIYTRKGDWSSARDSLENYLARVKENSTAYKLLKKVAIGETLSRKATHSDHTKHHHACIQLSTRALQIAPHSVNLLDLRAKCALGTQDAQQAVSDLLQLIRFTSPSTSRFLKVAQLSYFFLPPSNLTRTILKQCLRFDPDSKPCSSLLRKTRSFDKAFVRLETLRKAQNWDGIVAHLIGESGADGFIGTSFLTEYKNELSHIDAPASFVQLNIKKKTKNITRLLCEASVRLCKNEGDERWCEEYKRLNTITVDDWEVIKSWPIAPATPGLAKVLLVLLLRLWVAS